MSPTLFRTVIALLAVAIVVLLLIPRGDDEAAPTATAPADAASTPAGFYPPAPSHAVGMTPEWRQFADQVDRICALSFNYAMALDDRTQDTARARHWSDARTEAALTAIWSDEDARILFATKKLGQPSKRPNLFSRWRENVAHRTSLFAQASQAAGGGDFAAEGRLLHQIGHLKVKSDRLGQRFGLRICTSN